MERVGGASRANALARSRELPAPAPTRRPTTHRLARDQRDRNPGPGRAPEFRMGIAVRISRAARRALFRAVRHRSRAARLCAGQNRAVEPAETFSVLSADGLAWRLPVRSIGGFFSALTCPSVAGAFVARFMARAPYWDALFTALGTKAYVTTTSYSWPEKPELAVADARGIRSIIWAYSANSLTFSISDPAFRDVGVVRSIVIANEFWVWNRAYGQWLEQRRVEAREPYTIRIVGSLMCGNPALLELDARAARERLGLPARGLCIGVFDMPPISDAWRDRFGGGPPMVDTETYIAFWDVIERILGRVPDCYALIKLKARFHHLPRIPRFPESAPRRRRCHRQGRARAHGRRERRSVPAHRRRAISRSVSPTLPRYSRPGASARPPSTSIR